jgi:hypothetical protein
MTSLSDSLPQTVLLQPNTSAVTTAVPCLKVLAPLAWTRTVTCWPDPVQPTDVEPKPSATPDPDFWVTLTKTSTLLVPLQVTSSEMPGDQPQGCVLRPGPVGGGKVDPGLDHRLGATDPAAAGEQPGNTGEEEDATRQHEPRPPRAPRRRRGNRQSNAKANHCQRRPGRAGGRHRRQQTNHRH